MANDLEKFLQQAAERLAQKVNEANRGKARQTPPPSAPKPNPASSSRSTSSNIDRLEPEVIEAVVLPASNRRELGPDPLSNIDTRPQLAQEIDQADERLTDRLHDVFDHQISKLPQASTALADTGRKRQDATSQSTEVHQRTTTVHPIVAMLRRPEAIKNAVIISEIFSRRF